jgi:non-ribosomal peptide synthase protein (TIGR01720 family)
VGWFTTIYPVYGELEGGEGEGGRRGREGEDLKKVKEQLRGVPWHGLGYGVLQYLNEEGRKRLSGGESAEVIFNYLGQFDQVLSGGGGGGRGEKGSGGQGWELAEEGIGEAQSRTGKRTHVLEITGEIQGGCLRMEWYYNRELHREETVQELAGKTVEEIEALLAHCRTAQSSYTPSDFPLTRLSQAQLDSVMRGESIEDIYQLSPMQQGMLFETLQSPRSGTYINQICLEIEGPLDEEALHRAWKQVCRRHVSLRT